MTEKLFYQDSYLAVFEAEVLSCVPKGEHYEAVLSRTAFFPEGGGQKADSGRLKAGEITAKVLDVQEALKQIENAPSRQLMIQKYLERLSMKEEERKKAERLKIGIYEDLKDGLLDKEEYQKLKAEFDSRIAEADAAVKELNRQIAELEGSHCTNAAWMNYFQQFGRLEQLTRWAAAIIINKILVYEDNRIKITFNFEADLNRIQEILSAAEEHKKEAI